ncbi:hypothetical protein V6N13_034046 [Hibiscus sabdariffa]
MLLPENLTPLQDDDFDSNSEYLQWFNNNGKPFLASTEESQQWNQDQRCSYRHGSHSSKPFESMHPPEYFEDWESWDQDPTHITVSSRSTNPWEQPINRHQMVCGTSSQHTEAGVFRLSNVCEQPSPHAQFVGSSSYNPTNEEVYHPQFEHPQLFSVHGQSVTIDNMTSWLSTTTISSPLCVEIILSTPPTMQIMDDQRIEDELTPENPNLPRRIVQPPQRYDQTTSRHRQELPQTPNGVHPSSTCCQLQMASFLCKPAESEPLERGSQLLQAANAILKWRQTHK